MPSLTPTSMQWLLKWVWKRCKRCCTRWSNLILRTSATSNWFVRLSLLALKFSEVLYTQVSRPCASRQDGTQKTHGAPDRVLYMSWDNGVNFWPTLFAAPNSMSVRFATLKSTQTMLLMTCMLSLAVMFGLRITWEILLSNTVML